MNDQSRILVSLLVGIAAGVAIGVLFSLIESDEMHDLLQSPKEAQSGTTNKEDDWSDLNDSLGG